VIESIEDRLDGPVIFVVGAARSGTTWVFDLFNAHPFVHAVFESALFDANLGMAGLLAGAPNRWDRARKRHLVPRDELVNELRAFALGLLGNHMKPHHRHLVDKTPGHVYQLPLMAEVFPQARFIHMMRDGRDVAVSQNHARDTWAAGRWKHFPPPVDTAFTARRWARAMRCAAEAREQLGARLLEVRYDRLRADTEGEIRRILAFCAMPDDDAIVARLLSKTDFASTGRAADPTGFYRGGRTGDWRRSFTLLDALVFNALAGPELVEAGYEQNRRWRPDGLRVSRPAKGA
jgi:hypothetical protein